MLSTMEKRFSRIDEIYDFIAKIDTCDVNVNAVIHGHSYGIKNPMDLFALDLSDSLFLEINGDKADVSRFIEYNGGQREGV